MSHFVCFWCGPFMSKISNLTPSSTFGRRNMVKNSKYTARTGRGRRYGAAHRHERCMNTTVTNKVRHYFWIGLDGKHFCTEACRSKFALVWKFVVTMKIMHTPRLLQCKNCYDNGDNAISRHCARVVKEIHWVQFASVSHLCTSQHSTDNFSC